MSLDEKNGNPVDRRAQSKNETDACSSSFESASDVQSTVVVQESSLVAPAPFFYAPGALLQGKYRIVSVIGQGGMGIVYKVDNILLLNQMALKTLNSSEIAESALRRFYAEAKLLASLDHPGLVKVFDFGATERGAPFLVMELVEGPTLAEMLKRTGVIELEVCVKLFIEMCFAIDHAHKKGIIHRDIKPSNVILTNGNSLSKESRVKVIDFGIAKLLHPNSDEDALTKTGELIGSPFYMSPEQCSGGPLDARTDIYSMGCVFYEVLTGAPPFSGTTSLSTMMMHQTKKPLPLREASLGRSFPVWLEDIILQMLEKDRENRQESLLDVADKLIRFNQTSSSLDSRVSDSSETRQTSRKRRLYGFFALAFGVLVLFSLLPVWNYLEALRSEEAEEVIGGVFKADDSNWSQISADGKSKIFSFPKKFSIGSIRKFANGSVETLQARGIIEIPKGVGIVFRPNSLCISYPKMFRKFRPDDLYGIEYFRIADPYGNDYSKKEASLTDDEMVYFNKLTGLKALTLSDEKITNSGLAQLVNLKSLKELDVSGSNVTGSGLARMPWIRNLNRLKADGIEESEKILGALAGSQNMICLSLAGCDLADVNVEQIVSMSNISDLNISINRGITDRGVALLTGLKHLSVLNAAECSITANSIQYLEKMNHMFRPEITVRDWSASERKKFDAVNWRKPSE